MRLRKDGAVRTKGERPGIRGPEAENKRVYMPKKNPLRAILALTIIARTLKIHWLFLKTGRFREIAIDCRVSIAIVS